MKHTAGAWRFRGVVLTMLALATPASAQVDLTGEWSVVRAEDNVGNTELGDWVGIPMTEASRLRSAAWDASIQTLPEWQCRPHGSAYISRGPSALKIWKEVDAVSRETTAWHLEWLRSVDRPVYMDGRRHPSPNAPYTWAGFSTGEWVGDMLRIRVTHLKEEYLKRDGVWHSDKIELTQYLIRRGDYLTFLVIAYDPVYLSEPLVRSTEYRLNLNQQIPPYPCTVVTEVDRPKGVVPHYLPGTNNDITWFSRRYGIPMEVVTAGAANMYPEIRSRIPRSLGGFGPEPAPPPAPPRGQRPAARAPMIQPPPQGEIEVLPVRGSIYVLFGAGANIVASVGNDGVLLVDSGQAAMTDKVLAALGEVQREWVRRNAPKGLGWGAETRSSVAHRHVTAPPKPIRYIVNTSAASDHVGGNEKLRNAGRTFTGGNVTGNIADAGEGAAILAHEQVLKRLATPPAGQTPAPFDAQPTDTYYTAYMKLSHFFNGEGVQLVHVPKAHSDADSIVYFRGNDVIALGELMATERYPMFDVEKGGSINGIIDGLNGVLDLAIPEFRLEGGTMMVPGHGRIVDSGDVAYYRDMLTIIRDRVQDLIAKELTLDEVKAARPAADYDPEYGDAPEWTSDMFIEAVYKSLGGGKPLPRRRPR